MAGLWTDGFYKKAKWKKCRAAYIAYRISMDGGLCELCRDAQGEIVHHKQELDPETIKDPEIAYGFDNLMFVCWKCHGRIHGEDAPRVYFDSKGNVKPVLPPKKFFNR